MDFTVRSRVEELMDDPNMSFGLLKNAYRDINFCNKWLGGESITIQAVWKLIKNTPKKSYTILDMGCGDGTMLWKLSNFLSKHGVFHKMMGVDQREDVLAIARERCKGAPQISFHKADILMLGPGFECDIVINTLTMHHFEEERIGAFLQKFVELSSLGVVINDLERSKVSYALFKIFGPLFLQTHVAKYDGLVSISKGFKKHELLQMAKNIPSVSHDIRWKWAFRYVWVMEFNRHNN
ncbi:methyltransferase domain-containing protein [Flagellimonas myxillae]|uniref:methyltransferase domain-containing protein n=1 Tax=Flagellimonas myxillae TaxID=2942214 RepID=UPI00201EACE8|nr:methyltransferase domain-containing protein [Muricauda myxillae]MCL6265881.1 methyltransferase domain-containing protein [Muricauda myxillae]